MSDAYTKKLRDLAKETAKELGILLHEGVYAYMPGPSYETPAEIRMLRILGADAVGMSTVPEALVAAHAGMQILGLSFCCNMAAGICSEIHKLDFDAISRENFALLVRTVISRL